MGHQAPENPIVSSHLTFLDQFRFLIAMRASKIQAAGDCKHCQTHEIRSNWAVFDGFPVFCLVKRVETQVFISRGWVAAKYILNVRTVSETLPGTVFKDKFPSNFGSSRAAQWVIGLV
jgi:hypothetical protein